jgi:hypothetical protein
MSGRASGSTRLQSEKITQIEELRGFTVMLAGVDE